MGELECISQILNFKLIFFILRKGKYFFSQNDTKLILYTSIYLYNHEQGFSFSQNTWNLETTNSRDNVNKAALMSNQSKQKHKNCV